MSGRRTRRLAVVLVAVVGLTVALGPGAHASSAVQRRDQVLEATAGPVTRHPLPADASAYAIATGPDGNLWFAFDGSSIGRMWPDGTLATFTHPEVDRLVDLVAGPDGNVWFTFLSEVDGIAVDDGGIGRITPAGLITVFDLPYGPNAIVLGPDGNLWFAGTGLGRITPAGVVSWFGVAGEDPEAATRVVAVGSDGRLWHDVGWGGDPTGMDQVGAMSTSGVDALVELSEPIELGLAGLRSGPTGAVWYYTWTGRAGVIEPDGTVTEFSSPSTSISHDMVSGPDGNLWAVAYNRADRRGVARISPAGETMFFDIGKTTGLTVGADGALWFSDDRAVGRLELEEGPTRRPDARIRVGTLAWYGDGAYSRVVPTGLGQVVFASGPILHTTSFRVSVQNDGDAAEAMVVRGQGSTPNVTVAYHAGSTDVTARVVAGTYRTPVLTPGRQHRLRVTLTPTRRATWGSHLRRAVIARSSSADVRDVVVADLRVDAVIRP